VNGSGLCITMIEALVCSSPAAPVLLCSTGMSQSSNLQAHVGRNLRSLVSALLRKNPWLAIVAPAMGVVIVTVSVVERQPLWITLVAELFLVLAAYVWGYSERSRRRGFWPLLSHLRRSQYAATWDALAHSREAAGAAVSGKLGEENLRTSAGAAVQNLCELVSIGPEDEVVELGCGVGRIGVELASRCRSWTGADISENMLHYAEERLRGVGNVRLRHLRGSGLAEFPDTSADVVYATNMLAHLDEIDRWTLVTEAFRILRPAGRIFIDNIDIETDEGWNIFRASNLPSPNPERPPYQPRPSTAGELSTYAIRAGFDQVRAHNRSPLVIVTGVKTARGV
jgi:SAM-dependent methyltransferase